MMYEAKDLSQVFVVETVDHCWKTSTSGGFHLTLRMALRAVRLLSQKGEAMQYHLWRDNKLVGSWNAQGKRIHVVQA